MNSRESKAAITIGDRVRYQSRFLRSVGIYTGELPFARGIVTALEPLGRGPDPTILATIDWKSPNVPERVNVLNLEKCK